MPLRRRQTRHNPCYVFLKERRNSNWQFYYRRRCDFRKKSEQNFELSFFSCFLKNKLVLQLMVTCRPNFIAATIPSGSVVNRIFLIFKLI